MNEFIIIKTIEVSALEITAQGMIAENKQREIEGASMAYTEEDFVLIAKQIQDVAQQIRLKKNRTMKTIWKEKDVVMLGTSDQNCPIFKHPTEEKLRVGLGVQNHEPLHPRDRSQHLYILSDEEIKEGDWYYSSLDICSRDDRGIRNFMPEPEDLKYSKKIIATTNPKLLTTRISVDQDFNESYIPVPQVPQSFVELFAKEQGIDKVLVEYKETGISQERGGRTVGMTTESYGFKQALKLTNNEINIKLI